MRVLRMLPSCVGCQDVFLFLHLGCQNRLGFLLLAVIWVGIEKSWRIAKIILQAVLAAVSAMYIQLTTQVSTLHQL
jgi:hypothetical protein